MNALQSIAATAGPMAYLANIMAAPHVRHSARLRPRPPMTFRAYRRNMRRAIEVQLIGPFYAGQPRAIYGPRPYNFGSHGPSYGARPLLRPRPSMTFRAYRKGLQRALAALLINCPRAMAIYPWPAGL